MLDCFGEQFTSLFKIIAGIEQAIDLCAVFGPFFDLVEIASIGKE